MQKAEKFYKDKRWAMAQDDCHGDIRYPDDLVKDLIEVAYYEGQQNIIDLANQHPNDADLGETIRILRWQK